MKTFKSKKQTPQGIWSSEVRLKVVDPIRRGKIMKLLAKLEKEGFNESISGS